MRTTILLLVATHWLTGCSQPADTDPVELKPTSSHNAKAASTLKPLVFYALDHEGAEPDEQSPSLVLSDFQKHGPNELSFIPDNAPYITVCDREDIEKMIAKAQADKNSSPAFLAEVEKITDWVARQDKEWYGFQFEPPEIAGDGTARRKGLAEERVEN